LAFSYIEGDIYRGLSAPKMIKVIDIIIERACFYSGAISGAKFFEG
jgi:hypothetical protein